MKQHNVYLVAHYAMRPKTKSIANTPGWMKNPDNISYDEQVLVTQKLRKDDLASAKIILDLSNKQVTRNMWRQESSFDDLFEYFYNGYPKYLDPVIEKLGYELVPNPEAPVATTAEVVVQPGMGTSISSS